MGTDGNRDGQESARSADGASSDDTGEVHAADGGHDEPDALEAAGLDEAAAEPDVPEDARGEVEPDEARVELLRTVAEDVRGDSSESKQLSAILYRVSDLYDPEENTSPEEIYLNVRNIMQVKARGGLRRDKD